MDKTKKHKYYTKYYTNIKKFISRIFKKTGIKELFNKTRRNIKYYKFM